MLKKPFLLSILLMYVVCGCSYLSQTLKLPGTIEINYSEFDDSVEVEMNPLLTLSKTTSGVFSGAYAGTGLSIGLYKSSRMNENDVIFKAIYKDIVNIETQGSLKFNVDGKIYTLSAIDLSTDIEPSTDLSQSSRRFRGSISLAKKIANSEKTLVRLSLFNGKYVEGELTDNKKFLDFFNKFYEVSKK